MMRNLLQYLLMIVVLLFSIIESGCSLPVTSDPPPTFMERIRAVEARGGNIRIYDVRKIEGGVSVAGVAWEKPYQDESVEPSYVFLAAFFFRKDAEDDYECTLDGLAALPIILNRRQILIVGLHKMIIWDQSDQSLKTIWQSDGVTINRELFAVTNDGRYAAVAAKDNVSKENIILILDISRGEVISHQMSSKSFATIAPDDHGFYFLTDNILLFIDINENGKVRTRMVRRLAYNGEIVGISDGIPILVDEWHHKIYWDDHETIQESWIVFHALSNAEDGSVLYFDSDGEVVRKFQDGTERILGSYDLGSLWGYGESKDVLWLVTNSGELVLYNSKSDQFTQQSIFK